MLKEIGNHFWKGYEFRPSNDPFRPWMAINFSKNMLGCRWCSRLLCIDSSMFGTKEGTSDALSNFNFLYEII